MRGIGLGLILPGGVAAPGPAEQIHQRAGGDAVAVVGAYVIVARKAAVLVLALGDQQVGRQRLQHMLVRAGRVGVAHADLTARGHGADAVGDDAVIGKVAAADDIARAGRRDGHGLIGKKAVDVGVRCQL